MARANTVLLNISGGEISPELYARLDLPAYQRGNQRIQNYIVLAQGGLTYRNGFQHVANTKSLNTGRIISFSFSESDTYVIEFTNLKLRFYRNFAAILNTATKAITAITKASPCVITSVAHGFSNDQEIFISGIVGMPELNNQFFIIKNKTADTFQLANIYGTLINSTSFNTYASGGTIATRYEINSPYEIAHIPDLHVRQSADTLVITHQKYAPYKLTRTDHTAWTIATFTRTNDPFLQKAITGATRANPGVITAVGHGLAVGDEVWMDSFVTGVTEFNKTRYFVNSVPTADTFTVKNAAGTPINSSAYTVAYSSGGIVIKTNNCPKTLAFLDSARLVYGNTITNPAGLFFSRSPDSSTGATRFDDFTTGTDATHAVLYTLAPVFDKQDAIQWITVSNKQIIAGCSSSVRKVTGDTDSDPISPSSINAKPINNIGVSDAQPYSSGQTVYYVDQSGKRIQSFLFAFQSSDFVTVNQNLLSNQLGSSNFTSVVQQRRDAGLLWVLREDGVLAGMTFNELESIFGWHRHYLGGESEISGTDYDRAKVISITVEPRPNEDAVLWALVERTIGANTYRSVEYLTNPVTFVEMEDFFTQRTLTEQIPDGQEADIDKYINATGEQLKNSIHVDSAISYDGSALSTTITMTPTGTATGASIFIDSSAAFFLSSMVDNEIWKEYDLRGDGGGRARITGIVSTTRASAVVLSDFDNTDVIPAGSWYLTTDKVFGLLHMVGQTLALQEDGAPAGNAVVASDGSLTLTSESSKVHTGFGYLGLSMTLNLDVAGERGSAQAKMRRIIEVIPRFHNTVGCKIGTTFWNAEDITFKTIDDVTDRPTPLFAGVQFQRPSDSYTRQTKQIVVIQDIPSPQTLLSLDVMMETSDP